MFAKIVGTCKRFALAIVVNNRRCGNCAVTRPKQPARKISALPIKISNWQRFKKSHGQVVDAKNIVQFSETADLTIYCPQATCRTMRHKAARWMKGNVITRSERQCRKRDHDQQLSFHTQAPINLRQKQLRSPRRLPLARSDGLTHQFFSCGDFALADAAGEKL